MAEKKPYEIALEQFEAADTAYQEMQAKFLGGDTILEIVAVSNGPEDIKQNYLHAVQALQEALEERNVRRKNLADALRQAVALAPGKWRGPEGKADELKVGRFTASSVTHRGFDQKSLFDLCQQRGILERLLDVKTIDKKTGKEKPIVEQTWDIDYDGVMRWLKSNRLQEVIDGAYDEAEKTPQVKGPKELYFLGDQKKD